MRFLAPGFLHLAWLLVIPVALYLYRREAKRQMVSTLLFFRLLAREHQEAAWLRQLKRWLSLLMTLLMGGLAIMALGKPIWGGGEEVGALVIVMDRSASMGALDEEGTSRLEEGKLRVREMLSQVPESVAVSLVAFDVRAEVVVARSRNRRECLRLIDGLAVRPMEGLAEAGQKLAGRLASLEGGSGIWWVTDEGVDQGAFGASSERRSVRMVDVGLEKGLNVGITAFQVRALPMERQRLEGFLQVTAAEGNAGPATVRLEVLIDGRLAQMRELEVAAGEQRTLTLPLEGGAGQLLEARLVAEGDCLSWDDVVLAYLPMTGALKVAWYAEDADPFTELAFQALVDAGRIEMWRGRLEVFPPEDQPDVYVFENWLPTQWPTDRPVIALRPPRSLGPLKVRSLAGRGIPHPAIWVPQPQHPVVFRAATERVALTQMAEIELTQGLEGLWLAGNEAVLAAGEVDGQRLVVGAFHPARSEQLALLPTFPLVLGNALLWCAADSQAQRGLNGGRTGELRKVNGPLEWAFWDGEQVRRESQADDGWVIMERLGAWRDGAGMTGVSGLTSAKETRLAVPSSVAAEKKDGFERVGAVAEGSAGHRLPVVAWLLVLLLLLLVGESYLFHRRAVY